MNRDKRGVMALGRFVAVLAFFAILPACSEDNDWKDLQLPLLMWTQEEGSWEQPSSHCRHTRVVDGEWNAWQDEWCEKSDGELIPLGATSPAAREAIRRGFAALKAAEPYGRLLGTCPTNRRHEFVMEEPIPMLEQPTSWFGWAVCAGDRDDLTGLTEPFATIAKAFLNR